MSGQDLPPGNRYNVRPPMGMARDLVEANLWARRYNYAMNGLVPVPYQVLDIEGNVLPASNNGQRNPYTAVDSMYRRHWEGEGAHPSSAGNLNSQAAKLKSGNNNNKLPLPQNNFEILRVLAIGPYFGFCLPMVDIGGLKEYHRLEKDASQLNWMTNMVKNTLEHYYREHLRLAVLPYSYSLMGEVNKKPQVPQGRKEVELRKGRKVKLRSFSISDMRLYEAFSAKKKELIERQNIARARDGPPLGAQAAAHAVQEAENQGWVIHANVHNTSLEEVKQAIQDGALHWVDWTDGCCLDDHWMWHHGNNREESVWGDRTNCYSPAKGRNIDRQVSDQDATGYRFDKELQPDDFIADGHLDAVDGPHPVEHRGSMAGGESESQQGEADDKDYEDKNEDENKDENGAENKDENGDKNEDQNEDEDEDYRPTSDDRWSSQS